MALHTRIWMQSLLTCCSGLGITSDPPVLPGIHAGLGAESSALGLHDANIT